MLLLDAEGTEIILEPFDPRLAERTQMILPCNRLLVFRQDTVFIPQKRKSSSEWFQELK